MPLPCSNNKVTLFIIKLDVNDLITDATIYFDDSENINFKKNANNNNFYMDLNNSSYRYIQDYNVGREEIKTSNFLAELESYIKDNPQSVIILQKGKAKNRQIFYNEALDKIEKNLLNQATLNITSTQPPKNVAIGISNTQSV